MYGEHKNAIRSDMYFVRKKNELDQPFLLSKATFN